MWSAPNLVRNPSGFVQEYVVRHPTDSIGDRQRAIGVIHVGESQPLLVNQCAHLGFRCAESDAYDGGVTAAELIMEGLDSRQLPLAVWSPRSPKYQQCR